MGEGEGVCPGAESPPYVWVPFAPPPRVSLSGGGEKRGGGDMREGGGTINLRPIPFPCCRPPTSPPHNTKFSPLPLRHIFLTTTLNSYLDIFSLLPALLNMFS